MMLRSIFFNISICYVFKRFPVKGLLFPSFLIARMVRCSHVSAAFVVVLSIVITRHLRSF
jgi:hypothetical protein